MTVHGSRNIARLGLMHMVATNIWTWIRYVLIEERLTSKEVSHVQWNSVPHGKANLEEMEKSCTGVECILKWLAELMYTCVIEYSLIGAGVMFVIWKNVGSLSDESSNKRSHKISADCSKTTTGLFCGLAFLAITFISMALFNAFILVENTLTASYVFFISGTVLLLLASLACIFAFWRVKEMNFIQSDVHAHNSAQFLDRLLLVAGLIGELIFSIAGLVGLAGDDTWATMAWLLLIAHIVRLVQVCLQTGLLSLSEQLRMEDSVLHGRKPGKQVITFLLVANIALFLMNTFEAQKAGISPEIVRFYGMQSWALLVRGCAPLCIFYRFHCSLCLAEIWKHSYSVKEFFAPDL